MGEALSYPEGADGQAWDAAASPAGGGQPVPNEGALLSQLIQLLSQRPRHSLLLSDLGALLPGVLRQRVKDQGGLRSWLQRYNSLFLVSGQPGKESVTLILGHGPESATVTSVDAAAAAMQNAPPAEPLPLPPQPQPPLPPQSVDNVISLEAAVGAPSASPWMGSTGPWTSPVYNVDEGLAVADAEAVRTGASFDEEVDGQCAVQLRGLPYRATAEDVRTFLGDFVSLLADESLNPIYLVLNRDGRPSGFARVLFGTPEAARQCRDELHLRSMEDRYVEVFLYSERPSRGRQRQGRGVQEDGSVVLGGAGEPGARYSPNEAAGVTREQVVRECRTEMAEPKKRRLLLSMLGVALSPGARSYLKQMDQGLKHFLAQFPHEFSVDGGKGCEYVTYTPIQLSEAIDNFAPSSFTNAQGGSLSAAGGPGAQYTRAVGSSATPSLGAGGAGGGGAGSGGGAGAAAVARPRSPAPRGGAVADVNNMPASPKPSKAPSTDPTPSCGRLPATPSNWGTPSSPWGPQPWLPPWPGAAAPPAGFQGGAGDPNGANAASAAAAAAWGAPPAWPLPQFWPGLNAGWPSSQFSGWCPPTGMEANAAAAAAAAAYGTGAAATALGTSAAPECSVVGGVPPVYAASGPGVAGSAQAAAVQPQGPYAQTGVGVAPAPTLTPMGAGAAQVSGGQGASGGQAGADALGGDGKNGGTQLASAVRLRGLPFSATEQDVLAFFAQHDIVDRISETPKAVNLLLRSNGRPSGQAVVQMRDRSDAELAQRVLSGQWMGSRYIEVFLYGEDMNSSNNGTNGEGGGGAPGASAGGGGAVPQAPTSQVSAEAVAAAGGASPSAVANGATMPQGGTAAIPGVATSVPPQVGVPMPPPFVGFAPPAVMAQWPGAAPWASMAGMQGGQMGGDINETSWEALFEFLGPEGMAAAGLATGEVAGGAPVGVGGGASGMPGAAMPEAGPGSQAMPAAAVW